MDQIVLASKRRSQEKLERLQIEYLAQRADVPIQMMVEQELARLEVEDANRTTDNPS